MRRRQRRPTLRTEHCTAGVLDIALHKKMQVCMGIPLVFNNIFSPHSTPGAGAVNHKEYRTALEVFHSRLSPPRFDCQISE